MIKYALLLACSVLPACATTYTTPRAQYYGGGDAASYAPSQAGESYLSLFSSDSAILSDADIARVLDHKYVPPSRVRIALLPFGWSAWSGWSEQMAIASESMDTQVLARLKDSPRIYDASFLPSILVPEKRTVPFLREAAARYQADLILVYRAACRSFDKYRFLRANQTRAFCAVEAALIDVRTGLVPFVATSTQNFEAMENEADLNFRETILRSQLDAIGVALGEISKGLVQFLDSAR